VEIISNIKTSVGLIEATFREDNFGFRSYFGIINSDGIYCIVEEDTLEECIIQLRISFECALKYKLSKELASLGVTQSSSI